MKILAIDPGKKGGLALFKYNQISGKLTLLEVIDTPCDKKTGEYKYCDIWEILIQYEPELVLIENTLAIASSGTTNAKEVGIGEGMWKCMFALLHLNYEYIYPNQWTKKLGLKNDKTLTAKENKLSHVDLAADLYPGFKHLFYGPKGGIKDGIADAVLIGTYWNQINMEKLNVS